MPTTTPHTDDYAALDEAAHQLRRAQPIVGQFLIAAVGMTRSGELSPRQLAHAALSVANRLGEEHRPFADQLRRAVQGVLPPHRRTTDSPDYAHPVTLRRDER
jgi:hypothetical protein